VILDDSPTAVTSFLDGHRPGVALRPNSSKFTPVSVAGRRAYWWSETLPVPKEATGGLGTTLNGYVIQIEVQNVSEARAERALALMLPSLG
jgi:hypothetical protein